MKEDEIMSENMPGETVIMSGVEAETVLECAEAGETRLGTVGSQGMEAVELKLGQTIASEYIVVGKLGAKGAQAVNYIARRSGEQCVIKVYHKDYRPSELFVKHLKNHKCPYVAELYDYGYEQDYYYEIYKFYEKGTLKDRGKCSTGFLKKVVIPSLNEGLNFLHNIGGVGIVHGDIKPDNLFLSDDEDRIIIGDFGISSDLNGQGKAVSGIQGTPEYAPPTRTYFSKTRKTPAYDYGSMGLVLIKLASGYLELEGLNQEEIAHRWTEGITIPESIEKRTRRLIEGLLVEDENLRYGYKEVRKWIEGEFVEVKEYNLYTAEDYKENQKISPLIIGVADGKVIAVDSLSELADAIADDWQQARQVIHTYQFIEFIKQFDAKIYDEISEILKSDADDEALFKILYVIKENKNLIFRGKNYGLPQEFIASLGECAGNDEQYIITYELLEFYLKKNNYSMDIVSKIHDVIMIQQDNPQLTMQILYYLFHPQKIYQYKSEQITDMHSFIELVLSLDLADIEIMANDISLQAWLYSMGYKDTILHISKL